METDEYARMAAHERDYWWHRGRLEILRSYLRVAVRDRPTPVILNVGCGTGGTIAMLAEFGRVVNVDASPEAVACVRAHGDADVSVVEGVDLPFPDGAFDVVGAFDVLEHIADDVAALREWVRVLAPGGAVVLSVPAYPWLWSDHDVALHHHRRYTMSTLLGVAAAAGLRPERRSYAIAFSLPLVVGYRMAQRLRRSARAGGGAAATSYVAVPQWVNAVFTALLRGEARLHRRVALPAGTSVVTVLRRSR